MNGVFEEAVWETSGHLVVGDGLPFMGTQVDHLGPVDLH